MAGIAALQKVSDSKRMLPAANTVDGNLSNFNVDCNTCFQLELHLYNMLYYGELHS
jgi:hypothetical protein